MNLYFISLFPEIFDSVLSKSIIGRAHSNALFSYKIYNPRDFSPDKHLHVDDHPYGGGKGMVLRADVLEATLRQAFIDAGLTLSEYDRSRVKVIATVAGGVQYTQRHAEALKSFDHIFIVCGHYEGIDQRFIDLYCDEEISIGPFVLTGGELPALTIADSILRLLPGVLGSDDSSEEESFSLYDGEDTLVEYPHYTRPAEFNNLNVPDVLLSGNHAEIVKWRLEQSKKRTSQRTKE